MSLVVGELVPVGTSIHLEPPVCMGRITRTSAIILGDESALLTADRAVHSQKGSGAAGERE